MCSVTQFHAVKGRHVRRHSAKWSGARFLLGVGFRGLLIFSVRVGVGLSRGALACARGMWRVAVDLAFSEGSIIAWLAAERLAAIKGVLVGTVGGDRSGTSQFHFRTA